MRHIFYPLLLTLLLPSLAMSQKSDFQNKEKIPISIMTREGLKTIYHNPGKLQPKPPRKMGKKKINHHRVFNPEPNFQKISRNVVLANPESNLFSREKNAREFFIYYPAKEKGEKQNQRGTAPAGYFATVNLASQVDVNNFNTAYPGCTSVGELTINGASINDISILSAIIDVVEINVKNTALVNLSALSGLVTITDSLVIENNASLTSIGLSGVSTLGGIILRDLPSLTSIDAFSSSINSIANDVIIKNVPITSLAGLSAITNIGKDFVLQNTNLVSASEMNNLVNVGYYLTFEDNSMMTNIGLTNLEEFGGFVFEEMPLMASLGALTQNLTNTSIGTIWLGNMEALNDISGLQNLTWIANMYIYGCSLLQNLQGLESITQAPYGISLYNNGSLNDISALNNITSVVNGTLEIAWNNNLSGLTGLGNITEIDALWIYFNGTLTGLNALNQNLVIHNVNGNELQIYNNPNLSLCGVPAICNFLGSGNSFNPQVHDNTGDCSNLALLQSACGTVSSCSSKSDITWNGAIDDDWDNPDNWTPNEVPDACSIVYITSEASVSPYIYGNEDVTIGGLIMNGMALEFENPNALTVTDTINLSESGIYDAGHIKFLNVNTPRITYTDFGCYSLEILNHRGTLEDSYFFNNSISGNVTISDNPNRNNQTSTFGNDITGSLTFINNSNHGNNYLSNGNASSDIIDGDLIINNTSTATLYVGLGDGEPLEAWGNVSITETYPGTVFVDKITFSDLQDITLTTPNGATPFKMNHVFFRKSPGTVTLNQPLMIEESLLMSSSGGFIITAQDKMLIIADNAVVTDEDPVDGSFIQGPVKKIGDDAFTFPTGQIEILMGRTGNTNQTGINEKPQSHAGYYKAPISISAPSGPTSEFVAEYRRISPTTDGYNASSKDPGVGNVIDKEYWILERTSGSANVEVTLTYDQFHIEEPFTPATLQVVGWDGSKWINWSQGTLTGDPTRGTITSGSPLTSFGPLGLSIQGPLTVTWIYFKGINKGKSNLLEWATANESNSKEFIIERSTDAQNYSSIGSVKASGNTTSNSYYQFLDKNIDQLDADVIYYRLAQVDLDGRTKYSDVVPLKYASDKLSKYRVYPNPTTGMITVVIGDKQLIGTMASVYDEAGKLLQIVKITSVTQQFNFGSYSSGTYHIKLANKKELRVMKH